MIRTPQQGLLARHIADELAGTARPTRDADGKALPLTDADRALLRDLERKAGLHG
jgi:hypothetical protein